ncbi:zinc-binding dehydrogenase [Sphingomonas sp. MMS24-JH45]
MKALTGGGGGRDRRSGRRRRLRRIDPLHRLWRTPAGRRLHVGPDRDYFHQHAADKGVFGGRRARGKMVANSPTRGARTWTRSCTLAAEGRIRPRVHAEYPLDHWREAFDAMQVSAMVGKLVLVP